MARRIVLNKNIKWFIIFICLIIFLFITEISLKEQVTNIDEFGYSIVSKYLISDETTPIIKTITWFGSGFCLILLTIIFLVFMKNKKIALSISLNLVVVTCLNSILKLIFRRARPIGYRIIEESGYSFPSGHSMVSMAFYGFLIYLTYKYIKNKYLKIFIILLLSILIISIGISRIYLGVHYTTDVVCGFIISFVYLILFIRLLFNKYIKHSH